MAKMVGNVPTRGKLCLAAAGVLAFAAVAACGQSSSRGPQGGDGTGTLVAAIAGAPVDDVTSVRFRVVASTASCEDGAVIAEATANLEQESIPVAGGLHRFSDHLFVLAPGTYRICATPLQADGSPSEECDATEGFATVMSGVTTETTLIAQCSGGPGNGGGDVIVGFNHPPLISDLEIDESKFIFVCESVDLTVTATDPDGNTLTATWAIIGRPSGSTAATLVASGFSARFTPDVVGDYTLRVTVDDSLGGVASLTFPIHVSAGGCPAPDAAVPPTPDAAVPPTPDAAVPTPDAAVPTPDAPVPTPDAAPPTPDAAPPTPDAAPPGVDISGTWISRVMTTGAISVPLITNQPANIDIILRIVVAQSGDTLENHLEFCRINTATIDGTLVVNFPTSVLALLTDDQTATAANLMIGGAVPLPDFTVLAGQDAAGNSVDSDNDGNPGVTIPTTLFGNAIMAHSGLELTLSFPEATLTDADTIDGESAFETSGVVFNTVPGNLMGTISVVPGSPTISFQSMRLDGDVPCSEVLTRF